MYVFSVHTFVFSGQIPLFKPSSVTAAFHNPVPNCPPCRSWDFFCVTEITCYAACAQAVNAWELFYVKYAAGFVAWLFHFSTKFPRHQRHVAVFFSAKVSRKMINKRLMTSLFFATSKKTALVLAFSLYCTILLVDWWALQIRKNQRSGFSSSLQSHNNINIPLRS